MIEKDVSTLVNKTMSVRCVCSRCGRVSELWADYNSDEDAMFDLEYEFLADIYNEGWEVDDDLCLCPVCLKGV